MTDIRSRVADTLYGQAATFDECSKHYIKGWAERCADALLSLPGIAIVDADSFGGIADAIREDIKQARADGDDERRGYLRGELHGFLQAVDILAAAVQAQE